MARNTSNEISFTLNSHWKYEVTEEEFPLINKIKIGDIKKLCQSTLDVFDECEVNMYCYTSQHGRQKYFKVVSDKCGFNGVLCCQMNGGWIAKVNDKDDPLWNSYDSMKVNFGKVMNELWKSETSNKFQEKLSETFNDKVKQILLAIVFANNANLLQNIRKKITYV